MAIAGAVILVVVLGIGQLARKQLVKAGEDHSTIASAEENSRSKSAATRVRMSGSDLAAQGSAMKRSDITKGQDEIAGNRGAAAAADGESTQAELIETEAETAARERYEQAQRNAFKYRKLDPNKIKPTELAPAFDEATKKYNLPENLLAALSYVETGGTHRDGAHSMEAGYGVMNLRESNQADTVAESAALIGKSKDDVFYDQRQNIEAAAALLARYYEDALASGVGESEALYMAVSMYSGRPNPELAAALADEVAGWLIKGFTINVPDGGGVVSVPPDPDPPFLPKNWKLVGLQPPGTNPAVAPASEQANASPTPQ